MLQPELASANHGMPAMPTRAYSARERKPRRAPSAVPMRSAAKVWPVTGTGEPGTDGDLGRYAGQAAPPRTRAASTA